MTNEEVLTKNKAFIKEHFEDFVNNRDAAAIERNMTADFLDHDGPGGQETGIDGDKKMMEAMYLHLPGIKVSVEDMVAEGDKVMCRNIWRWTDSQSGKAMEFHGFVLWRLEGGKIAERWATVSPPQVVR